MIDPYKKYKNISVSTMTRGEQLILLFDKAIQRMVASTIMIDEKKYDEAKVLLDKTVDIFNYLIVCLDKSFSLSPDLVKMYSFINSELIMSKIKNDKARIEAVLPIVRDLRDTWSEAEKISRTAK